jgi:hypothetical protein
LKKKLKIWIEKMQNCPQFLLGFVLPTHFEKKKNMYGGKRD